MKRLFWIVPILVIAGIWLYFKYSPAETIDGLEVIPADAMYVIDCDEPIENWKIISGHRMWQGIKTHPFLEDLTEQANYLDTLIANNAILFKALGHRRLIISAHKTTRTDYDFLFVVDLKNTGKKEVALTAIKELYELSGYTVTGKEYKGNTVYSAFEGNEEPLHFVQHHQQLICSYRLSFVHKALSDKPESKLINDERFQKQLKQFSRDGLGQVYFNYNLLDQLAMCYMDDGLDVMQDIGNMTSYSMLNLHQNDNNWQVDGVTALDSSPSFLKAVVSSSPRASSATKILSNRTAWYLSLNFKSFKTFQEELFRSDEELRSAYETNSKRLGTLLDISVEEDLVSWIGTEVTVAQMRKNKVLGKDDNYVILARTSDIQLAEDRLNHISEQIKARTPAKFKQIEYRTHVIRYLDIKGFFKTFMGEAFNKIYRPYYLILEDYVVFSNSPYTLVGLIEDYENKRCLVYDQSLPEIEPANLILYYSPTNLHPALAPLINTESKGEYNKNKVYFDQFSHGLITLKKHGSEVSTLLLLQQASKPDEESVKVENEYTQLYRKYAVERDANNESFVLEWIYDGVYIRRYPGSDQVNIEASTKNGVLHGSYTEYYKSGEVKVQGKYKNGQKKGTWKYFSEDGSTSRRKF
jgi:hypothetical protein